MSNEQLIRSAHIWAIVLMLAGAVVFAGTPVRNSVRVAEQNSNSNSNTSGNQNQNSNTNTRNRNSSNSNASGERTGMGNMSARDHEFIMDAAMGGMMEVQLGRWAAQKGTSAEVKQFGQRMVDDHSKANTELMQLASSKGMTMPTELDQKHKNDVSKISRLTGEAFDRAYSKMMLKDHQKDVSEFEKQSTSAGDADVKAFATNTLPTLREHLEMARALPGNVGSGNSNANRSMNSNSNSNSNGNSNRP